MGENVQLRQSALASLAGLPVVSAADTGKIAKGTFALLLSLYGPEPDSQAKRRLAETQKQVEAAPLAEWQRARERLAEVRLPQRAAGR